MVKPFLKWAGGKSQLLPEIRRYLPERFNTYFEPFVGGGAVLFDLQPEKAVINDSSEELINVYRAIRDDLEELLEDLKQHVNEKEYFYQVRSRDRNPKEYAKLSPVKRASRIIFLNKTCYNGLFRVNRAGQFNTPFGDYRNPNIVNESVLRAVNDYLNCAEVRILCRDFAESLEDAGKGDFVYLDPPYDPVSRTSSFTGYQRSGFDRSEQERLKLVCDELNRRDVKFLLSNSATPFIRDIYRVYRCEIISARRAINSRGNRRGEVEEMLVRNYD